MSRLTVKWKDKLYDLLDPVDIADNEYSKINFEKVITKLGEYEDLEEQGLLVKLPCKVGDTVWVIDRFEDDYDGYQFMGNCGEYVIVATEYAHCTGDFKRQLLEMVDESYDNFGVDVEIYHKDKVFLTEEEAKKALELKK